jgi:hypothetical protein
MTTKHQYTQVEAWTSLPDSHYVYETDCDLPCGRCDAVIPVNSYFARKMVPGKQNAVPHCRQCRPFHIYTNMSKRTIVPREDEYLHVREVSV